MKLKSMKYVLLSGFLLCAAGVLTVQAQNTYITFSVDMSSNLANGSFTPPPGGTDAVYVRGIFDGWANPGNQLFQVGDTAVYTNTFDDAAAQDQGDGNANFIYVYTHNGAEMDEGPGDWQNRMAYLPPGNNASLILPTAYYNDLGPAVTNNVTFRVDMSEQIEVGAFRPQSGDSVVVFGSFQGWNGTAGGNCILTNDPTILVTNNNFNPPVVESNVYTTTIPVSLNARQPLAAPNCAQEYKYIIEPEYNYDGPAFPNNDPDSGNRFFVQSNQVLPIVNFSDQTYSPLAKVTLNLDMSAVARYDSNFVPNTVTAWGTFNGWANGVVLTNNTSAANTNLYSATVNMGEGASFVLQYRYTNSSYNGWVYDYAQDGGPNWVNNNNYRRIIRMPVTPTLLITNVPAVYFNDLAPDDLLPVPTPVQFSVDMNGAVGNDGHVFAAGDNVYINGIFAGATPSYPNAAAGVAQYWYPWSGGVEIVPAPAGYQMIEQGSSTVYTNTIVLPAGTPVGLSYQYGMDPGGFYGGPLEDESTNYLVHYRVVRSTGVSPYVMPIDAFTNQPYVEPFFSAGNIGASGSLAGGQLTVGPAVAGEIPVSWLGRPGAHLQSAGNLSGPWTDVWNTDGTNWTAGTSTTNGLLSVTNWPSAGNTYFRLVKP